MATVLTENTARHTFRPSFHFWIVVVMSLFIFGGFSLAALQRHVMGDTTPMPPVVHLHGVTFVSWMTLLIVQTFLINVRNVALHRSLGTFGIALATAVLFTGSLITALGMRNPDTSAPFYFDLNYLSVMALLGFGFLITLAFREVRNPEYHRRLILFATIPLLPPGINRMYQVVFQLSYLPVLATYLTMAAIVAAMLVYDWRSLERISKASMIGAAVVLGQELLHYPISRSDAFADLLSFLGSLIYYR
ncbi:MAG: hypothetical protein PVF63_06235 [Gammaproteobacteria bacterium]|jgi:hypothetical protein